MPRVCRSEAFSIPSVLVATVPSSAPIATAGRNGTLTEDLPIEEGEVEEFAADDEEPVLGYYSDGAYVALPLEFSSTAYQAHPAPYDEITEPQEDGLTPPVPHTAHLYSVATKPIVQPSRGQ